MSKEDTCPNTDNESSASECSLKSVTSLASFKWAVSFEKHKCMPPGKKLFQCETCGEELPFQCCLIAHSQHHLTEKKYKCEKCSKLFAVKQDMKWHMRIHKERERIRCETCQKEFVRHSDLMIHMRSHTGERTFKCDYCDKAFSAKSNLIEHKDVHLGPAAKRYKCGVCNRRFRRRRDRKIHMRLH